MASNGSGFLPASKNKREFFLRALLWTLAIHGLILLFFMVRVSWEQKSKASAPMMVELWEELPQPPRPTPVKPAPKATPKPPPLLPKADIALKKEEKAKPEEKKEPVPPKKENVVKKIDNPEPKEPPKKTVVAQKEEPPKAPEKLKKEATKPEPKKAVKVTQEPPKKEPPKKEPPKKEQPKKEPPKQEIAPKAPPKQPPKKVAKAQETPKPAALAKPADSMAQGRANVPSSSTIAGNSTGTSLQGAVLNGYIQKIQTKIYRYMNTALCGPGNWEVIASVHLMPGGVLLDAPEIDKSSGMAACDRAIIAAIMQAEPLPVPEDPVLFSQFRHLNLKFRPQ